MRILDELIPLLRCPDTGSPLKVDPENTNTLRSSSGREFPVVEGMVIFNPEICPESRNSTEGSGECEISVLILTLDEEKNIGLVIRAVREQLESLGRDFEIVVIDGNSQDQTQEIARAAGARVVSQRCKGYAQGFIQGLQEVRGRILITLDGDCSHPASLIPLLLADKRNLDIVVGSRWIEGGAFHGPFLRLILSKSLNLIFRCLLAIPVSDLSSGFRLYHRKVLRPELYQSRDFSILEEVLILAISEGYRVGEVPMQYHPRHTGTSHVRVFQFAKSFLSTFVRMWTIRHDSAGADYDDRAYKSVNLIQRWWQRARLRRQKSLIGTLPGDAKILIMETGASKIAQCFPSAIVLNKSISKLRFLGSTNKYRIQGFLPQIPFTDSSFDLVIASHVLEQLPFESCFLDEVHRVLKPGGKLVLSYLDYSSTIWIFIKKIYNLILTYGYTDSPISRYSNQSLSEKLCSAGFTIRNRSHILASEYIIQAYSESKT